jgi:hypothetical protein
VTQYRYRVWDGTQPIEPFTPEDAMDFLAGEILDGGDLRSALNRLMRQGANMRDGRRMPGMRATCSATTSIPSWTKSASASTK